MSVSRDGSSHRRVSGLAHFAYVAALQLCPLECSERGEKDDADARARDADSKNPGRLQILHYNLDRFSNEIKDLRGLETLLVAS